MPKSKEVSVSGSGPTVHLESLDEGTIAVLTLDDSKGTNVMSPEMGDVFSRHIAFTQKDVRAGIKRNHFGRFMGEPVAPAESSGHTAALAAGSASDGRGSDFVSCQGALIGGLPSRAVNRNMSNRRS